MKERGTEEISGKDKAKYFLHANASESGIILRHAVNKGRLIVSATFRPHAEEHPSDRDPIDTLREMITDLPRALYDAYEHRKEQ